MREILQENYWDMVLLVLCLLGVFAAQQGIFDRRWSDDLHSVVMAQDGVRMVFAIEVPYEVACEHGSNIVGGLFPLDLSPGLGVQSQFYGCRLKRKIKFTAHHAKRGVGSNCLVS